MDGPVGQLQVVHWSTAEGQMVQICRFIRSRQAGMAPSAWHNCIRTTLSMQHSSGLECKEVEVQVQVQVYLQGDEGRRDERSAANAPGKRHDYIITEDAMRCHW
jgi:hypothetical protein